MWLRTRISTVCFHCPIGFCCGFRFKSSTSVALSKDWPSLSNASDEFLSWLQRKAGLEVSSVLSVGNSTYGRSLFASKFIHAGDCIVKIPFNLAEGCTAGEVSLRPFQWYSFSGELLLSLLENGITPDKILPEVKSFLDDELSNTARLALVLLVEQGLGQVSEWAPYICSLPQIDELHSAIFWSKEELEMVRLSPVYEETIHQKAFIEKEFSKVKPVFEHFPQIFEGVTFEQFVHAYAVVGSRAWGTASKGLSLIPFADFLNHDGSSEAFLLSDEDKEISEVISDRDYSAGEEVLISYGKFSNATLLLDFGFTLPYNPHDQVRIWMDLCQNDPLYSRRLEILNRHQVPTDIDACGFNFSRNAFTIKEVRSARGRGIPPALRAFTRILSATSCQELEDMAAEAARNDGRLARHPLKSSREIQAHCILLSRINSLIQEYTGSIVSLQSKESWASGSRFTFRKQMARDVLAGELRVLQSVSTWLKNYCTSLSAGNHP